jgi:hypothetical protein
VVIRKTKAGDYPEQKVNKALSVPVKAGCGGIKLSTQLLRNHE